MQRQWPDALVRGIHIRSGGKTVYAFPFSTPQLSLQYVERGAKFIQGNLLESAQPSLARFSTTRALASRSLPLQA